MSSFDKNLRQLRQDRHLSQTELAALLKISRSSISMYERGEREPDFETLNTIADFFHIDMNTLLGHAPADSEPPKIQENVSFDDMDLLLARNGKKLTPEQKQDLIRTLRAED